MQYVAFLTKAGARTEVEFPDAPGCHGLAERGEPVLGVAKEALEGWLEAHLVEGPRRVPRAPRKNHRVPRGAQSIVVTVDPILAAKVALRRARLARELTQEQLARRLGIKQAQVAKLENPDFPSTLLSLKKAADALDADVDINIELRD